MITPTQAIEVLLKKAEAYQDTELKEAAELVQITIQRLRDRATAGQDAYSRLKWPDTSGQ